MPGHYKGLSSADAKKYLDTYGPNTIPQKKQFLGVKFLKRLSSPISLMLMGAALLSAYIGKMFDSQFILFLLILNVSITIWQEYKADASIAKLNARLSQFVSALRDSTWQKINTKSLVVNDLIRLSVGDIIPADGVVLETTNANVNEAALTGESLPVIKKEGDPLYSGSFLTRGMLYMRVSATGKNTSLGKTLYSVERIRKQSMLERDILRISLYLSLLSICAVIILSIVFILQRAPMLELLTLDLSLLIAGVPISLPTVMTLIIEFGALNLAGKKVIIRRLSALEDLANVNLLLTDKTGTLTTNTISVEEVTCLSGVQEKELIRYSLVTIAGHDHDPIDHAIAIRAGELGTSIDESDVHNFVPADSVRKYSSAAIKEGGMVVEVAVGAPQQVISLCNIDSDSRQRVDKAIEKFARRGFRSIAVAVNKKRTEEKRMELMGIIALSDKLRDDAKDTLAFLKNHGITTVMVTGDHEAIASEIARELSLDDGKVITKRQLDLIDPSQHQHDIFQNNGAFAEILPDDKYKLVTLAKKNYVVASNGDGVNDLPAVKAANVGIAVKSAVSSLKSVADIVLESNGISVIKEAIVESRKIFARIYSYSIYRMSESLRLIITIAIVGILSRAYPLTPLQLILLALLNDIPIISLATDRVKTGNRPSTFNVAGRIILSTAYGSIGVINSLVLFGLATYYLHLSWPVIQTLFFLKLTISGHLLIYVAHTRDQWYRFLPSKQVILATTITQLIATILAFTGIFMPGSLNILQILFIWVWALFWMQVSEMIKDIL